MHDRSYLLLLQRVERRVQDISCELRQTLYAASSMLSPAVPPDSMLASVGLSRPALFILMQLSRVSHAEMRELSPHITDRSVLPALSSAQLSDCSTDMQTSSVLSLC